MKNKPTHRLLTMAFCISWFVSMLHPAHLFAIVVPMELLDSEGSLLELEKNVAKNSDHFIEVMKKELITGNLVTIGFITNILKKTIPANPEVKSFHSIYLVSTGDVKNAIITLKTIADFQKDSAYVLYAKAMIKHREGKLFEAEKICKKAILLNQSHPYPRNILGRIYFDQDKNQQALTSFKKAIELEPNFLPAYNNLGAVSYAMGHYEQAIVFFKQVIELDPRRPGPHYGLAIVYQTMGKNSYALEEYLQSYKLNPSNTSLLLHIGNLQIQLAKYKDARETGELMLKMNLSGTYEILGSAALHLGNVTGAITQLQKAPNESHMAAYLLGYCFIIQGNYTDALQQMKKAHEQNPSYFGSSIAKTTLLFYLDQNINMDEDINQKWNPGTEKLLNFISGCIYSAKGQWEKSEHAFKAADNLISGFSFDGIDKNILSHSLKNDDPRYIALGVLLYMNDLLDSAYFHFEKALQNNKNSFLANFWVAQIFLKKGDKERATAFYKKSLNRAPTFFSSLYAVGELSFVKGDTTTAAAYYEAALKVKKDTGLLIKLGLLNEYNKKYKKASKLYQEAIDLSPDNFIGYNQLAWLYAKRGINLDRAMKYAEKANSLQPGNVSILDTIGWIYYHKKDFKKSLKNLEKSYSISSNNPTVLYHLGIVHNHLGDRSSSKKFLTRALEISGTFEEAADARKQLANL